MKTAAQSKHLAFFLSFIDPDYSRSSTLLNFQSEQIEKKYIQVSSRLIKLTSDLIRLRKELKDNSVIVIMSPAHKVTFLAKLITGKKVILDAGWPLTDGVISRGHKKTEILKLVKSYILDFASFHSADLILTESASQSERIRKMYLLPGKRIEVSYTGLNEKAFTLTNQESLKVQNLKSHLKLNPDVITVLFRGKINNESGIDTIISSAQALTKEANFIFLTGRDNILKDLSPNCYQLSDVSGGEMAQIYALADVALGQISNHQRLKYTIPHKAFEAGYFGKCYLTPKSLGVLEIFDQDECYFLNEVSTEELISCIRALAKPTLRVEFESNISKTYQEKISQRVINTNFERILLRYSK